MATDQVLAIDQGTHSTRAIVFDMQGRVLALARQTVELSRHNHAEVEQSPAEILQSMESVIKQVLVNPAVDSKHIMAVGLATQRSSVLAWDRRTGEPLSPLLSWQDTRSQADLEQLGIDEDALSQKTGLHLSAHYGAGKLRWLRAILPAVGEAENKGTLALGPLAAFLVQHLLKDNKQLVDHANASRTLLWNLESNDWDDELLALFDIKRDLLPDCVPICGEYGSSRFRDIPLTAVNGDQTAALYALGMPPRDTLAVNIGTGAFVLMPVDELSSRPADLLAGISMSDSKSCSYYIEGTVNGAAAALDWAGKHFKTTDFKNNLGQWLIDIKEPQIFVNTVGGLGSPWWIQGPEPYFPDGDPEVPAAMAAVCESILFLLKANIDLMLEQNPDIKNIRISGGLASMDALCQKLADLSGLQVQRPPQVEATARGIAWLAAGSPEGWSSGTVMTFNPGDNKPLTARYARFVEILNSILVPRITR